jgi:hypothetical protein
MSWIIVSKKTGKPVCETFSNEVADTASRIVYDVYTAKDWLEKLNRDLRNDPIHNTKQ